MSGWVEPEDRTKRATYWLTMRSNDAAKGYDMGLPDVRCRYEWWPDYQAWTNGYTESGERNLYCLHSNNGWRLEREA